MRATVSGCRNGLKASHAQGAARRGRGGSGTVAWPGSERGGRLRGDGRGYNVLHTSYAEPSAGEVLSP